MAKALLIEDLRVFYCPHSKLRKSENLLIEFWMWSYEILFKKSVR